MKLNLSLILLTAFCAQSINAQTVTIDTDQVDEEIKQELQKELANDLTELKRKYEGIEGVSIQSSEESDKSHCCKPRPCCGKPCGTCCCKDITIDEGTEVEKCGCGKPKPRPKVAECNEVGE